MEAREPGTRHTPSRTALRLAFLLLMVAVCLQTGWCRCVPFCSTSNGDQPPAEKQCCSHGSPGSEEGRDCSRLCGLKLLLATPALSAQDMSAPDIPIHQPGSDPEPMPAPTAFTPCWRTIGQAAPGDTGSPIYLRIEALLI